MSPQTTPTELTYVVPGVSCSHCEAAISKEVAQLPGIKAVDVDLETKRVTVRGEHLDDASVRAAIADAGYDVGG